MPIKSYDPRITRLGIEYDADDFQQPVVMDQLETYEIFTEVREGKGYTHVGIMHGANETLAFLEAKEQYGRRGKCFGVWTVKTANVHTSNFAELGKNIFECIEDVAATGTTESYDIFIQPKRGKECKFLGQVNASHPENAYSEAKKSLSESAKGCRLWCAKTSDILKTTEEDKVMFETAPEKQFREALIYKIKDRIDAYRIKNNMN